LAVNSFCVSAYRRSGDGMRRYNMRKARISKQPLRPNFIRQWREHRQLTLDQLAERVPMDKGNLSKVERSLAPYTQPMLERLAEALQTEPASLLMRNPVDPAGIWSIWDQALPGEQRQIVQLAETVLNFRQAPDKDPEDELSALVANRSRR